MFRNVRQTDSATWHAACPKQTRVEDGDSFTHWPAGRVAAPAEYIPAYALLSWAGSFPPVRMLALKLSGRAAGGISTLEARALHQVNAG